MNTWCQSCKHYELFYTRKGKIYYESNLGRCKCPHKIGYTNKVISIDKVDRCGMYERRNK
jgi:hypothetical protein